MTNETCANCGHEHTKQGLIGSPMIYTSFCDKCSDGCHNYNPQNHSQSLVPSRLKEPEQVKTDALRGIFSTEDLEKEIEKIWNFHLSHNQEMMSIHEFKKWADKVLKERQRLKKEVERVLEEICNLRELPAYDYDDSLKDKDGKQIRSRTYKDIHYGYIIEVVFKELKKRLFEE